MSKEHKHQALIGPCKGGPGIPKSQFQKGWNPGIPISKGAKSTNPNFKRAKNPNFGWDWNPKIPISHQISKIHIRFGLPLIPATPHKYYLLYAMSGFCYSLGYSYAAIGAIDLHGLETPHFWLNLCLCRSVINLLAVAPIEKYIWPDPSLAQLRRKTSIPILTSFYNIWGARTSNFWFWHT